MQINQKSLNSQTQFKYSLDGLIYSSKSYNTIMDAAYAAYKDGNVDDSEIFMGASVYIGQLIPLEVKINIDTLLYDITSDLSEYINGRLNEFTYEDKKVLSSFISNFIKERNPNLYDIKSLGVFIVDLAFIHDYEQKLKQF